CHTKELFRHNIWFDDLIELTTPDEQSIHQFLTLLETSLWNKKNTLQFSTIENRPSIVFLTLFCENGQRVVLLGCGQNYDECYQSLLPSLPKDIKYVNVFVVNQVNNIIHFDIKDPLPI